MTPPTPSGDVTGRKRELRAASRRARAAIGPQDRADAAVRAVERLLALPELADAATVALYAATGDELDVTSVATTLRERGATVLLPRVAGDRLDLVATGARTRLRAGYRSILEPDGPPAPLEGLDAVIVPGLAFDPTGGRLGRGGGHYDRLLAAVPSKTVRVGACFEAQMVDVVPRDPHDEPVDVVVTEHAVRRAQASRRRR